MDNSEKYRMETSMLDMNMNPRYGNDIHHTNSRMTNNLSNNDDRPRNQYLQNERELFLEQLWLQEKQQ